MINSITIKNFQKHKKLLIEFGMVTTIVGASDAGKSAVLRALRWALLNKPNGKAFLRDGTKEVSVEVSIDESTLIRKRNGESTYQLNSQTFRAFGSTVPEDIADFLRVDDLNFQLQHDAPFWIGLSASSVARELNSVMDLQVIDAAIKEASRDVANAKREAEIARNKTKEAKETERSTRWAVRAAGELEVLETWGSEIDEKRHQTSRLASLLDHAKLHRKTYRRALDAVSGGTAALSAGTVARHTARRLKTLAKLVEDGEVAERLANVKIPDARKVKETRYVTSAAEDRTKVLKRLLSAAKTKQTELKQTTKTLDEVKRELAKAHKGICPLCKKSFQ